MAVGATRAPVTGGSSTRWSLARLRPDGWALLVLPALALIGAVESLDLVIPWWQLAQVMIVIPLIAAACAWGLTRSRVPLERRVT